jgi:ABC-2 type transport system ATP-binding protein
VIVAQGAPDELGGRDDRSFIRFRLPDGVAVADLPVQGGRIEESRVVIQVHKPVEPLARITAWALERGYELPDLEVERPSLEDVYLELTESQEAEES